GRLAARACRVRVLGGRPAHLWISGGPRVASRVPRAEMTAHDDPNAVYALGGSSGESARLQRQSDELEPVSLALLDRVNPKPGDRVIDVGCGPRGILDLLAARVLPGGSVVGIDSSPVHVAMASQ